MVEEKITSRAKPTVEIEKKRFCCWVREIEHEVAGVELVTKKYREEVVVGYWRDGKKNGMIYELDRNGKAMRGCLYENDTMKRVVMEFKGSEMVEYDRNGKKVYEGGYTGDMKNGFVRNGKGKEMNGNGNVIYTGEWKNGKGRGKEMDADGNVMYEGEWWNGKRNGKGKEMDENGRVVFVGEWKDGKGRGKEMDADGNVMYEGEWSNGKRNGEGKEMDASGRVVRSGCWVDGKYKNTVMIPSSLTSNPQGIEELRIGNNGYNDDSVTELKLSWLVRLKRIVIGDECFGKVRVFELDGLGKLESVVIGESSFRIDIYGRNDGSYRIVNCPKLKSIQIGTRSFYDYHSFELNNLPSLQSIDIGMNCFYNAPSFSLTGLIDGLV